MAAGMLWAPGTKYGPCEGECKHRDCAETRAMAAAECVHCDEAIGYDTRFYRVDRSWTYRGTRFGPVYAHARCEEATAEERAEYHRERWGV